MGKYLIQQPSLPVAIVLVIVILEGTYILSAVGMICSFVSSTLLTLTIIAYFTGLASEKQALSAVLAGFVFYTIPQIGRKIVSITAL